MKPAFSFISTGLTSQHERFSDNCRRCRLSRERTIPVASATTPERAGVQDVLAAGLSGSAGPTGTFCANLYPVPVFGQYGWFLTVYKRSLAAKNGAMVVQFPGDGSLRMRFRPDVRPGDVSESRELNGIAAGNINVRAVQSALGAVDGNCAYELRMFERGGAEPFFNRRGEVSLTKAKSNAPTVLGYRVENRADAYELRTMYTDVKRKKTPAVLEYFAMNLFPILILRDYSALVAVWRQEPDTSAIAIERRGSEMAVGPFEASEIDDEGSLGAGIGRYATTTFYGAVSDTVVAKQHRALLDAIRASNDLKPKSDDCFRIVVDSTPNTLTNRRRNEIWIQVEECVQ